MSIWFEAQKLEDLNLLMDNIHIHRSLGLKVTEIGEDFIHGTMPADERTFQPFGIIHGGANVALAVWTRS